MPITKEQFEFQYATLCKQRQEHLDDLNAVNGAIQLCEHFISMADATPIAEEEKVVSISS